MELSGNSQYLKKMLRNQNPGKNETRPVRMVLLENFGAEPFTVEVGPIQLR
jgi:hypothetical protein